MSATSNDATRPASVTGIPEGVGFWLVLALVLVAATACALVASAYMAGAPGQGPFVGT